eukprot:482778_1
MEAKPGHPIFIHWIIQNIMRNNGHSRCLFHVRTYSRNRSKAHSRVIPPTRDSPSLTHCSKSAEITPPPHNETETIEITNGKSLLFSSWFSQNGIKDEEEDRVWFTGRTVYIIHICDWIEFFVEQLALKYSQTIR